MGLLTACCLRKLCQKKGKLDVTKPKKDSDPGTPGNYSSSSGGFNETKPLMGNGHNTGIPSDSGSDNTDQSLLSEEPLCNQSDSPLCSTPLPPSLLSLETLWSLSINSLMKTMDFSWEGSVRTDPS